jgi:hypothetical protein
MTRFRHTIALTLSAVAVTATGALASPGDPPLAMPHDSSVMEAMPHGASVMEAMPHGASEMAAMHASMASDAEMVAHMTGFGIDPDELAGWMAEGVEPAEIHDRLEARGVDASEMLRSCPHGATMADSMTSMHGGDAAGMHGGRGGGEVGMGEPRHEAHHGG